LEFSRKKLYIDRFGFCDYTVILAFSGKKLYADCFGVRFHAAGSKGFGSGGIICTARTWRPAAYHRHSGMPCDRECDSYQISQSPATSAQGRARERAYARLQTSSGRFHAADRNEVKSVLRAVAKKPVPWQI
jgi:hypothetical protein